MTTDTELRELLAAESGATPRPWGVATVEGQAFAVHHGEYDTVALYLARPDAALVAAAVNALPGLLDRADRAEAEVERLRDMGRRSRQMSRVWEAEERAEAAEAEAMNNGQDYDRRGERLWRLAAKAGWRPGNESDNDATAEWYIAEALVNGERLRTAIKALADEWEDPNGAKTLHGQRIRDLLGGE